MDELELARRCADGDAQALATLQRDYLAKLKPILLRSRFPEALVDDALQRFTERLLKGGLATYGGSGSLLSWLRVGATRQALNMKRDGDRKEVTLQEEDDALVAAGALSELTFIQATHKHVFEEAFVTAIAALDDRERTLLRLCYVDGLTVERMGRLYGADKSTVSRWLTTAREKLHDETRACLKETLKLRDETCDELVELLRSHLDVSLRSLFGASPDRR